VRDRNGRLSLCQQVQGYICRPGGIGHDRPAPLRHQPCQYSLSGSLDSGKKLQAFDIVDAYIEAKIGEGMSDERRKVQADGFAKIQEYENENFH